MVDERGDAVIDTAIATQRLVWGIVAHLIADWLLQNNWMAENKHRVGPAMFFHALIHGFWMIPFFTWKAVIALMVMHALIDTRIPLRTWQSWLRQTREGEVAMHVSIWADQVVHISCIAFVALLDSHI